MRRPSLIGLWAIVCFLVALSFTLIITSDAEQESDFVKSFRDPDRVDQRWLYVAGFGAASFSLMLWSMHDREKNFR